MYNHYKRGSFLPSWMFFSELVTRNSGIVFSVKDTMPETL